MNNNDFVKRFNDLKDNFEDLLNNKINEAKSLSGEELAIANLKIAKSKELLAKDDKGKNFFDTNDLFAKNKFVDRFVEMNKALETDDYSLIMDALSKKIPTTDKYKGSYFEDEYEVLREDIKVYLSQFDFVDERVIKDATLRDSKNNIIPLMSKNTDLVNYVFNLVAKYQDMILREKMRINKFGFNDIELFAYNILVESKTKEMVNEKIDDEEYNFTYNNITKTEVAKMLSNKYKYIMVDEYQDTNELQDDLMESLYTNTESYHNNFN